MSAVIHINLPLQAGNTYTLHIPTTLSNDGGYSPYKGNDIKHNGEVRENFNGFWLESIEVGEIVKRHTDKVAIDYRHILPVSNVIWFYAITGERVRMAAIPMIVHDHSSIAQGGPAYGTYFSYMSDTASEGGS